VWYNSADCFSVSTLLCPNFGNRSSLSEWVKYVPFCYGFAGHAIMNNFLYISVPSHKNIVSCISDYRLSLDLLDSFSLNLIGPCCLLWGLFYLFYAHETYYLFLILHCLPYLYLLIRVMTEWQISIPCYRNTLVSTAMFHCQCSVVAFSGRCTPPSGFLNCPRALIINTLASRVTTFC
jgi:hypothetical protein